MALPSSSGINFYNQDEVQAWITAYGMEIANSLPPFSLATRWWSRFAMMAPNAPKKLTLPFPLSVPALSPSNGRDQPQMATTEFATYDRDDPQYIGHMQ